MKNLPLTSLLIFSCATAWAADFEKGLAAAFTGDFATALAEWKPLAEQGNAKSQYNLGLMLASGQGVIQDNVSAYMWWNIAGANGHENAKNRKEILAKGMSPEEVSSAGYLTSIKKDAFALQAICIDNNYKNY